jgi:hypothetical protein
LNDSSSNQSLSTSSSTSFGSNVNPRIL